MKIKEPRSEAPVAGFTRLDLLAVVIMTALLGLVLSPALARTRVTDQSFQCLNNLRQLMGATLMYTHDYNDLFPPNPSSIPITGTPPNWTWCPADAYDADSLKDPARSLLVPYLSAKTDLFRCPADTGVGRSPFAPPKDTTMLPRARDYCMNEAVGTDPATGGKLPVDGGWLSISNRYPANTRNGPWLTYGKTTSIPRPAPAGLLVLLEVCPKSLADAGFRVTMLLNLFDDCPGFFHDLTCNLAFADGHTEIKNWTDSRITMWPNEEPYIPPNPDVLWVQARTSALK